MTKDQNNEALEFYRRMVLIRSFEARAEQIHADGEVAGPLHTAAGQEGAIVGACMALNREDYMTGTHRSHGHPIAKGAALGPLMAELLGKKTGVCQGKGGSMHLSDFSVGSLGETSIVGSGLPIATGAALGSQLTGDGRVALCFFGDGAANQGTFNESINLAAIWKLPVIFFCENNLYAMSSRVSDMTAGRDIADRAHGYGIPGIVVDGQDVLLVHAATREAVERARSGNGPTLIEAKTYRYGNHAVNMGREFVDRGAEVSHWLTRDPIQLYRTVLLGRGIEQATLDAIDKEITAEVEAAIQFARESPYPAPREAFDHVFIDSLNVPEWLVGADEQPQSVGKQSYLFN